MNPRGCSDARSHCGTQNRAGGAAVPAALSSSNVWVGFNPVLRSAAAPVLVTAAFLWLELIVPDVLAATREASEFSVPAGRPDEYMQAGAAFARELDPGVEISFWDSQRGSLSVVAQLSLLALGLGVVTGLGAVVFRDLIGLIHNLLFTGHALIR